MSYIKPSIYCKTHCHNLFHFHNELFFFVAATEEATAPPPIDVMMQETTDDNLPSKQSNVQPTDSLNYNLDLDDIEIDQNYSHDELQDINIDFDNVFLDVHHLISENEVQIGAFNSSLCNIVSLERK